MHKLAYLLAHLKLAYTLVFYSHFLGSLWPFQFAFLCLQSVLLLIVQLWFSIKNHLWATGVASEREKFLGFYVLKSGLYPIMNWGGKMKTQLPCLGVRPKSEVQFTLPASPVGLCWGWSSTLLLSFSVLLSTPSFSQENLFSKPNCTWIIISRSASWNPFLKTTLYWKHRESREWS